MGIEEIILEMARQEGFEKGYAEVKREAGVERERFHTTNLIIHTDFDDERIASLAGVSIVFVEETKPQLNC